MPHAYQEHFKRLLQLIRKERAEDRKQYELKINHRSLEERKKEGVTWYPVIENKSFLGTGEKWVIKLERTTGTEKKHHFQAGSSASLFLNKDSVTQQVSGVVSQVNEKYMTLVLHRDEPPEWINDGKLGVNLLFDESTYDQMEKTMKLLVDTREASHLNLIDVLVGNKIPVFHKAREIRNPFLNQGQIRALQLITSAEDVALIHGPPGTGKTTTLVEAIIYTVEKEKQVLITAASNAAVDLLVEKLSLQSVRVLRLGHPARVTEAVVNTTLDARLSDHNDAKLLRDLRRKAEQIRSMAGKFKRNFGRAEREERRYLYDESKKLKEEVRMLEGHMIFDELNKAQVIACTLSGANHSHLRNRKFKTVFIDEASQAVEPAMWIPLLKAEKVVMAGDHWQLPPTIKSFEAAKEGLETTIFERMMKEKDVSVMLQTQYRMHDDIMQFSNLHFYKGELKSADVIEKRRQVFQQAVKFIDTAGCGFDEKINPETLSTYNTDEADFLLKRLHAMIEENPEMLQMSIGIIAPYRAQTVVLNELIATYPWYEELKKNMSINSVDAFQGQERDVIMMSLVRSNDRGEIGFLSNKRRMNVAMTRAKHLMMMIGDSGTLSANPFFDELIQNMQDRNLYHSAFEYLYN
ncbi:MAG: ATP-dependent RNA/DNA helicase IGHMBP2 [Cyclobacteriaceae bacterium]|jgi:superfamily I DNA and/or RNA helicase